MENRLLEMEVFVRTADRGSLTAAAAELGMSAQMAGRYLRGLERRLGVVLLVRATRHQHLSEAGQAFLRSARDVLAAARQAEEVGRGHASRPAGLLRVSAPVAYGGAFLMPRLTTFSRQFPDVIVDLQLTDAKLDPVVERMDVAIRIGDLPDAALIAREMPPYEILVCAAPSYLARRGTSVTESDSIDHDWIEYRFPRREPPDVTSWHRSADADAGRGRVVAHCNDSRAIREAVLAGLGLAYLPKLLVETHIASGSLVEVFPERAVRARPMHVLYPDRELGPAARAFVDWLLKAARRPANHANSGA